MPFAIAGKFFFLTYPQCTASQDDLHSALNNIRDIERAVIVREHHADGEPHLHAAVQFRQRVQSRNARLFDLGAFHCNIQRVRSWGACVNYCRKDGGDQTRYYGCTAEDAVERRPSEGESFDAEAACASASTRLDWLLVALKESIPYGYADAIWKCVRGDRTPTFYERPTGTDAGIIGDFFLDLLRWNPSKPVLCVLGPSGCGKSSWAKRETPLPFLFVTDIDNLGDFNPEIHKAIVFDECRFNGHETTGRGSWPLSAQIKLVTWHDPMSIRIRYKVAQIPRHIPKIFTCCNTFPFTKDKQITRRVHCINLYPTENWDEPTRWLQ